MQEVNLHSAKLLIYIAELARREIISGLQKKKLKREVRRAGYLRRRENLLGLIKIFGD